MTRKEAVVLEHLTKAFGDTRAVEDLNLAVHEGEIFGLLGPNGAGKTTTILMLLGLVEPTEGRALVFGIDATRNPREVKRLVGYLPDDVGFYEDLTGRENLLLTGRLNGLSETEANASAERLLARVGLEGAADLPVKAYSRGMRQRLGLADTLMKKPRLIVLDEPTLGIDPEGVREFLHLIRTLSQEEGVTVLLSSHHLHQVQAICDRVGIFVKGRLLAVGTVDELSRQFFSREPYALRLTARPLSEEVLRALARIPGVTRVEPQGADELFVAATRDVASEVAREVVGRGAALARLEPVRYGLDEIYHRFFEGVA